MYDLLNRKLDSGNTAVAAAVTEAAVVNADDAGCGAGFDAHSDHGYHHGQQYAAGSGDVEGAGGAKEEDSAALSDEVPVSSSECSPSSPMMSDATGSPGDFHFGRSMHSKAALSPPVKAMDCSSSPNALSSGGNANAAEAAAATRKAINFEAVV